MPTPPASPAALAPRPVSSAWLIGCCPIFLLLLQPAAAALLSVQRLSTAQVADLWRSEGYAFLDVRTPQELRDTGKVPNSVNVPWVSRSSGSGQQAVNPNFLQQVRAAFPDPATKLIVACQTGRRSEPAAQLLSAHYSNLVESREGFAGWAKAGLPVVTAKR